MIERTDRSERMGRVLVEDGRRLLRKVEAGTASKHERESLALIGRLVERRLRERGGVAEVRRSGSVAVPERRLLAPGRRDVGDLGQDMTIPTLIGGVEVCGYAAVFPVEGDAGTTYELGYGLREKIDPGAFEEDLGNIAADRPAFWNHDSRCPLARESAGTLQLSTDSVGLAFSFRPANTTAGRDLVTLVRAGICRGASFSFEAQDVAYLAPADDSGEYTRLILRCRLFEVSPVSEPAYRSTTVSLRTPLQMQGPVGGPDVPRGADRGELARMKMRLRLAVAAG